MSARCGSTGVLLCSKCPAWIKVGGVVASWPRYRVHICIGVKICIVYVNSWTMLVYPKDAISLVRILHVLCTVASSSEPRIQCDSQANEYHQCCRNFVHCEGCSVSEKSKRRLGLRVTKRRDLLVEVGLKVVDLAVVR